MSADPKALHNLKTVFDPLSTTLFADGDDYSGEFPPTLAQPHNDLGLDAWWRQAATLHAPALETTFSLPHRADSFDLTPHLDHQSHAAVETSTTVSEPNSMLTPGASGSEYTMVAGFSNIYGDPVTGAVFGPPDNALATSGSSVINAVNDTISWSKSDPSQFQYEAFSNFFPSSLVDKLYFTDPRVLYDPNHGGHYIVVEDLYGGNSQSKVLIAVSDSVPFSHFGSDSAADFNSHWDFYSIDGTVKVSGGKTTSIDFTQAAVDNGNLYISGDQFSGSTYVGNSETIVPLAQIESLTSNGRTDINALSSQYNPHMSSLKATMAVVTDPRASGALFVGYDGDVVNGHDSVTIAHELPTGAIRTSYVAVDAPRAVDSLSVTTLTATEPSGQKIDASDRRVIDAKLDGSSHLLLWLRWHPLRSGVSLSCIGLSLMCTILTVQPLWHREMCSFRAIRQAILIGLGRAPTTDRSR